MGGKDVIDWALIPLVLHFLFLLLQLIVMSIICLLLYKLLTHFRSKCGQTLDSIIMERNESSIGRHELTIDTKDSVEDLNQINVCLDENKDKSNKRSDESNVFKHTMISLKNRVLKPFTKLESIPESLSERQDSIELKRSLSNGTDEHIRQTTDKTNVLNDTFIKIDSIIDQSFDSMIETIDTMNIQNLRYDYSSDEDY